MTISGALLFSTNSFKGVLVVQLNIEMDYDFECVEIFLTWA